MEAKHHSRLRWFRFSLRTMLVLVTLVCILCGYIGWAQNWIRQRREFINRLDSDISEEMPATDNAPFPLWIFGEIGAPATMNLPGVSEEDCQLALRLFPETTYVNSELPDYPEFK
jgi:hypothetical protein